MDNHNISYKNYSVSYVLLLNSVILFYSHLVIQFTLHINCLNITAYCLLSLKMTVLNVPIKANSSVCALNYCIYNTQFLYILHSVPLYNTHIFSLYNTQFLSLLHLVSLYTTLSSSIYYNQFLSLKKQFLSILHSVPLYTTLNFSL